MHFEERKNFQRRRSVRNEVSRRHYSNDERRFKAFMEKKRMVVGCRQERRGHASIACNKGHSSEQTPWHSDRILGLDAEQTCNDYRPCLLSILPPLAQMPSIHAVAIVCSRRLSCWGGCCGGCCCCGCLMRCWSTEALSSLIYVLLHLSLLLSASKCQHLVVLVFTNLWQTQSLTHQILQMLAQYRSPQMPNLALKLVEISLSWNVPSLTSSVQDWQSIFLQNTKMLNVP